MVVEPPWKTSLSCLRVSKILVKTEVPEKPVGYIQVIYVIKNREMQRPSIKTCSTNNSRQRKLRVSKKIRATFIFRFLNSYKLSENSITWF